MATDLTISVEDRPGGLAAVGEALGGAGVNIEGVCGHGGEGRGTIHVCVEDAAAARAALEGAGIVVEAEADAALTASVKSANEPGRLAQTARMIADAGINIGALYLATDSRVVIASDDNAKVAEIVASRM